MPQKYVCPRFWWLSRAAASCDPLHGQNLPKRAPAWEMAPRNSPKARPNAVNAVISERMAPDGKNLHLSPICRLCACLGGTPLGGGLRPPLGEAFLAQSGRLWCVSGRLWEILGDSGHPDFHWQGWASWSVCAQRLRAANESPVPESPRVSQSLPESPREPPECTRKSQRPTRMSQKCVCPRFWWLSRAPVSCHPLRAGKNAKRGTCLGKGT